jgi:hypothetical protein
MSPQHINCDLELNEQAGVAEARQTSSRQVALHGTVSISYFGGTPARTYLPAGGSNLCSLELFVCWIHRATTALKARRVRQRHGVWLDHSNTAWRLCSGPTTTWLSRARHRSVPYSDAKVQRIVVVCFGGGENELAS